MSYEDFIEALDELYMTIEEIAEKLGMQLSNADIGRFNDGEVSIKIIDNVRGDDVYVVQPTFRPVNDSIVELLLMVSALRRASAKRITAVIPYYGYKRGTGSEPYSKSRLRRLGASDDAVVAESPIAAADVATMLEVMGVDRVIAVDLQPPGKGQLEGFFGTRVPVDNVEATLVGVEYFRSTILQRLGEEVAARDADRSRLAATARAEIHHTDGRDDSSDGLHTGLGEKPLRFVVVAPNEACIKKARDFLNGFKGSGYVYVANPRQVGALCLLLLLRLVLVVVVVLSLLLLLLLLLAVIAVVALDFNVVVIATNTFVCSTTDSLPSSRCAASRPTSLSLRSPQRAGGGRARARAVVEVTPTRREERRRKRTTKKRQQQEAKGEKERAHLALPLSLPLLPRR